MDAAEELRNAITTTHWGRRDGTLSPLVVLGLFALLVDPAFIWLVATVATEGARAAGVNESKVAEVLASFGMLVAVVNLGFVLLLRRFVRNGSWARSPSTSPLTRFFEQRRNEIAWAYEVPVRVRRGGPLFGSDLGVQHHWLVFHALDKQCVRLYSKESRGSLWLSRLAPCATFGWSKERARAFGADPGACLRPPQINPG